MSDLRNYAEVWVRYPDGRLKSYRRGPNLVTLQGLTYIHNVFFTGLLNPFSFYLGLLGGLQHFTWNADLADSNNRAWDERPVTPSGTRPIFTFDRLFEVDFDPDYYVIADNEFVLTLDHTLTIATNIQGVFLVAGDSAPYDEVTRSNNSNKPHPLFEAAFPLVTSDTGYTIDIRYSIRLTSNV